MSSDLVATMSMDVSDFTKPIEDASKAITEHGETTIRVIHEQQAGWTSMAVAVIPAITKITTAVLSYKASMAFIGLSNSVVTSVSGSYAALGATILRVGGIANSVAKILIPQWRIIGTVIGAGLLAYNIATSDIGQSSIEAVRGTEDVSAAMSRLGEASSKLGTAIGLPFSNATAVASSFIDMINPLPAIMSGISAATVVGIDAITYSLEEAATGVTQLTDYFADLANSDPGGAAALREAAAETARVIALQQSHAASYGALRDIREAAQEKAARQSEIEAIHLAKTEEEIQSVRMEYQQLFNSIVQGQKQGETLSANQLAHIAAITNAIEQQQEGIRTGKIVATESDQLGGGIEDTKTYDTGPSEEAVAALDRLLKAQTEIKYGKEDAARIALENLNATQDEIDVLLMLHDANIDAAHAIEQKKKADESANRIAKQTHDANQSAADEYERLTTAARIASGEITKGQARTAELIASGVDANLAKEIGSKIDAGEIPKEPREQRERGSNTAALAGSSEAAKILLAGVGAGGNPNKTLEEIAKQQLAEFKEYKEELKRQRKERDNKGKDIS